MSYREVTKRNPNTFKPCEANKFWYNLIYYLFFTFIIFFIQIIFVLVRWTKTKHYNPENNKKNRNQRYKNKTHNPDRQSTVNHKMQYKQITTQKSKTRLLKDIMAIIGHK